MGRVSNKVVIVTGAAAGLGAAIAKRLTEEGATVIRTDIAAGEGIIQQDVADETGWKTLIADTMAKHGRIDGLVNNAGISSSKSPMDPEGAELEDWRRINTVNVESVFLACKYAMPAIAKGGGGAIVNMSSIGALVPTPFIAAYGASKAAVASMTLPLARELARFGIRVIALAPGTFETGMYEVVPDHTRRTLIDDVPFPGRPGRPEESAHMVRAVVENSMMNGSVVRIDGAVRMREPRKEKRG